MIIKEEQLKKGMDTLAKECLTANPDYKIIIAKAVSLGMKYQEQKIKQGINIVFNELHNKY